MVKFGFSTKKKRRKSKAELWQEAVEAEEGKPSEESKQKSSSSSSTSTSSSKSKSNSFRGDDYHGNNKRGNSYRGDSNRENEELREGKEVTVQRNNSNLSHPGYDPFSADEYIPATKRRSQFDSSVLAMREEEVRSLERNSGPNYATNQRNSTAHPLSHQEYYDSNRQRYTYVRETSGDDVRESGPYRRSSSMYRVPSLDSSDEEVKKPKRTYTYTYNYSRKADNSPSRIPTPTTLSDISEDRERHFTQHERRRRQGVGGIGTRITRMCDSMAEGISETLSRLFNSTKLFFKTCFWSGRSG